MKNIDFTNAARKVIMNYLTAKANAKAAASKEKALKVEVEKVFSEFGKTMTDKSKSLYIGGFIQQAGKAVGVVWRKTWSKGTVDWQAYAMSLGGTVEGAEIFRKEGHWGTACDYATKDQQTELEGRA